MSRGRDLVSTVLMLLVALGAFSSFVFSLGPALGAEPEFRVVEFWRAYGFLVFAGLFVLLALRPRLLPGVWELVIFHKLALTVSAATFLSGVPDSVTVLVADGILTVLIVVSYFLSKGYLSWASLSRSL